MRFILIVLIGVGLYFFLTSDFFAVEEIIVEDSSYYTAGQIIELAGAERGVNLFEADVKGMKARLLADPYIKSASVNRQLLDKLILSVEEREEKAAAPFGTGYVVIDENGMALRLTESAPALPLLEGMTISAAEPGEPLQTEENARLKGTLSLLEAMEEEDLYFKKVEVSNLLVRAYIYDNLFCVGEPEIILENMDGLQEVLYDLYIQGIERGTIYVGSDGYFSYSPSVDAE
ncbi:MAG: FtsQ-type POTRA domain-containing protein [Bacillota bacterium]|nr:FtsQ-type POTRA domain-containing protein [Bacillota bacterium]